MVIGAAQSMVIELTSRVKSPSVSVGTPGISAGVVAETTFDHSPRSRSTMELSPSTLAVVVCEDAVLVGRAGSKAYMNMGTRGAAVCRSTRYG